MKKLLLLLTLLLTTAVGWAGTVVETLDRASVTFSDSGTSSKPAYRTGTIKTTNGTEYIGWIYDGNKTAIQMSSGCLVVTKSIGTVKSITFTGTNGAKTTKTITVFGSNSEYALDNYETKDIVGDELGTATISGNANDETTDPIDCTTNGTYKYFGIIVSGSLNFSKIEVTWETEGETPDTPTLLDPQLAYTPSTITATVDDGSFKPTLTYVEGIDISKISYKSGDEKVAKVETDGTVSIVGAGQTTITANFAGDEIYAKAEAVLTIKVTPKAFNLGNGIWQVVTSESDLAADDYIIFVSQSGEKAASNATMAKNVIAETDVTPIDEDFTYVSITPSVMIFKLGGATGAWSFYTCNYQGDDGYLGVGSSKNTCQISSTSNDASLTLNGNGTIKVAFNTLDKEYNLFQHNEKYSRFSCYASNSNQKDVRIYKFIKDGVIKSSPELSFEKASVEAIFGEEFTGSQVVVNPHNLEGVTYSSSNENVATVDANSGVVEIKAEGETTITANFKGDDNYKSGHAEYKLVVTHKMVTKEVANIAEFISNLNNEGVDFLTITGNVTVVHQETYYLYITDATGNLVINGKLEKEYANGTIISGITGKPQDYNGLPRMITPDLSTFADGEVGEAVKPSQVTIDNVTEAMLNQYVTLVDVKISGVDKKNATITDSNNKTIALYNTHNKNLIADANVIVTGFVNIYNGTLQITPSEDVKDSTLTGILDLTNDEAAAEYYNLQGVRMNGELTPGLYIRRQGATATKVLVK